MGTLVVEDSKACDTFDHRGRVRNSDRHHQGGDALAVLWSLSALGSTCITAFEDNKEARRVAQNSVCASNSKHVDIPHDIVRDRVFQGVFDIVAVQSEEQHADFLMKALAGTILRFHRNFSVYA